jgi:hypothetical protein
MEVAAPVTQDDLSGAAPGGWVLLLLALVSAAMLAPLASSESVPGAEDFSQHLVLIRQAAAAVTEGQFPIRVAPGMNVGLNYPVFQFYSPLPYQLAGVLHAKLWPDNPLVVFRLLLWAALFCGAGFTWRLARRLTGSELGAILAGVAYVTAPYQLVNIHARAAWTEAIALGLLPAVLWYAFRLFQDGDVGAWVGAALSWGALAMTHLITFFYGGLLVGLLFLVLTGAEGLRALPGLARLAAALALGCGLAWWHLEPVLFTPVAVKTAGLGSPFDTAWLTSFLTLVAPVSLAPEPEPGRLAKDAPGLHASVGWVMLAAGAWATHAVATGGRPRGRAFVVGLLTVFAVALLFAWSPVDLWRLVPSTFHVIQFPYRLLGHVAWAGALLVAFAIATLYPEPSVDARRLALGVLAVVFASASWMHIESTLVPVKVAEVMAYNGSQPGSLDQRCGYQIVNETVGPVAAAVQRLPLAPGSCRREGGRVRCDVTAGTAAVAEIPSYWYPRMIDVQVNGAPVDAVPLAREEGVVVGAPVPAGQSAVTVKFRGSARADAVSLASCVVLAVGALGMWARRRRAPATLSAPRPA